MRRIISTSGMAFVFVLKFAGVGEQRATEDRFLAIAGFVLKMTRLEECVFNKNYLTMAELRHLWETDFEGKEEMRQLLINRAPKYGNDIEQVDKYAHFVVKSLDDEGKKHIDGRGGELTTVWATSPTMSLWA